MTRHWSRADRRIWYLTLGLGQWRCTNRTLDRTPLARPVSGSRGGMIGRWIDVVTGRRGGASGHR
jgi:hypothetical protein